MFVVLLFGDNPQAVAYSGLFSIASIYVVVVEKLFPTTHRGAILKDGDEMA